MNKIFDEWLFGNKDYNPFIKMFSCVFDNIPYVKEPEIHKIRSEEQQADELKYVHKKEMEYKYSYNPCPTDFNEE